MNKEMAHAEAWGLAAIMIVVASWLFYRYFAPKTWREWASAGVVQAFIIALYAELYGFPLTVYLLTRLFVLDRYNHTISQTSKTASSRSNANSTEHDLKRATDRRTS